MTFFCPVGKICSILSQPQHGKINEILSVWRLLMRKWFALIFLFFLVFPSSAQAQNAVTLESLTVKLWSEYDQPSMLVIYDFNLASGTTLPATMDLRIPKDANITAVAYGEGSNLLNAEFSGPVEDGNWQVIKLFIKTPTTYHLEYYQAFTRSGNDRSFNYQWTGEYPINNFRVEVQVPGDSSGVRATPMLPFVPNQQFLSSSASVSKLETGKTYQVDLHYSRVSEEPVVTGSTPQAASSESVTQNTAGRVTLNNLPYILGGVGVLLIVSVVYYFWQSNSLRASRPRKRNHNVGNENTVIYCQECGSRALADDRFCRACGSKLRVR